MDRSHGSSRRVVSGIVAVAVIALLSGCSAASRSDDGATDTGANTSTSTSDGTSAGADDATPMPDPSSEPLAGLVVMNPLDGQTVANGFELIGIDPSSGKETVERTFRPPAGVVLAVSTWTPVFARMGMDPDHHRAAARWTDPSDGSSHVGWVTDTGEWVDVTALRTAEQSFSGTAADSAPAFGPDGAFFFAENGDRHVLSTTSTEPTASDVTDTGTTWDMGSASEVWVYPSGTIAVSTGGTIPSVENTVKGSYGQGRVEDWVSATTMVTVSVDDDQIRLSDATTHGGSSGFYGSGTDENERDLLPEREGRSSWNPVVSPDHQTIAFLSAPTNGDDQPSVFTVPVTGGEPTPMATDHAFARPSSNPWGGSGNALQLFGWW